VISEIEADGTRLHRVLDAMYHRLGQDCVLFPTTDTAVLTLARLQNTLAHHHVVISDPETVECMVMKNQFYRSLESSNVPHPETFDPETIPFTELTRRVTFPVYVRPVQSLCFFQHFRGKGFVAHTPRELQHYLHVTQRQQVKMLVQEIIDGPTDQGYMLKGYITRRGVLTAFLTIQKLWQASMFDSASILVTVPRAQVEDFSPAFLAYLQQNRYRGLFGAEFKRDARDGHVKLLEVNARSQGDSAFGLACGADNIYAAYLDAIGHDIPPNTTYHPGVHYIGEFASLITLINWLRRGQLSKIGDLRTILATKHFHIVSRDDPRPVSIDVLNRISQVRWALTHL
jgi:predicted ATP-grasp superfamily ATP-dependent carboligase